MSKIFTLVIALIMAQWSLSAVALEQHVSFQGSGGVAIAGTLVLPSSASPKQAVPAVLLIQGSGPTDRDGNQPSAQPTDLLRRLAQVLSDNGIASLRYDKRGMYANRDTLPKDPREFPSFFSWSAFVGDAQAAFAFLAAHPAVAAGRVGVFGHSEGGLIALDSTVFNRPKVLVLAGTPGRPLGQIINDQISAMLQQQNATPEQRRLLLSANERIQSEILTDGKVPNDVPTGLAAFYPAYLGPFLRSALALDPASLAADFKGPVLVINGANDTQVSAARDALRFSSVLTSWNSGTEVFIPSGVSHNLKPVNHDDDPGLTGPLDERVRIKLVRWLTENL